MIIVVAFALLVIVAAVVIGVRIFDSLPFMRDFIRAYPGASALPTGSPTGFPVWLNWQHFLNAFFILLIIRSGLGVRTELRPSAYWTPRWSKDGSGKVSLTAWFHQSVDVLWLINGVAFIVLLFVSGQWARIVPTNWNIVPNAFSALLHYVSLDWPHDDGWLNYNALQLLAYFTTTFIAAPLAAITGFRMSSLWPGRATKLSRLCPIELARRVHFPVMLYFVAFVVVHVGLVFATGAIGNLNHMYGARDDASWVGPVVFLISVAVMVCGLVAARPLVLRPLAALSGKLSSR